MRRQGVSTAKLIVKSQDVPNQRHEHISDSGNHLLFALRGDIENENETARTKVAIILAGTPFLRKSTLERYSWPISSACVALSPIHEY